MKQKVETEIALLRAIKNVGRVPALLANPMTAWVLKKKGIIKQIDGMLVLVDPNIDVETINDNERISPPDTGA